ncbi:MAG: YbjN domain-containing protein [Methanomethylophilus sp.]|jgi:hypothetical protein
MWSRKKVSSADPIRLYKDIRAAFDSAGLSYRADDTRLEIYSTFEGDDMPIKLTIGASAEIPLIRFECLLDFQAPAPSFGSVLEGLNTVNASLHFGAFVLDPDSGRVLYRYHFMFTDYMPTKNVILAITKMVVDTVDANDGAIKSLIPETTHFDDPMFG